MTPACPPHTPNFTPAPPLVHGRARWARLAALLLVAAAVLPWSPPARGQTATGYEPGSSTNAGGPIRLRQPTNARDDSLPKERPQDRDTEGGRERDRDRDRERADTPPPRPLDDGTPSATRSEFEAYVRRLSAPTPVRRFGAELATRGADRASADFNPLVPPDYLVKPGDEILVNIWGSVDADLRLVTDRSGRISIPRVGPVQVGGVRYADLPDTVSRRVGQVFRNFELSVSLGQLRGVRVYVTGFVARPGSYSVSSLSTLTQALLAADGPSAAGSFRNIELRRGGRLETRFDFYDFLLKGDRSGDVVVQADDVVHVNAVGPQVALIGSVNQPAIFELKAGDTLTELLRMAGGFNSVADRSRLTVERVDDRSDKRIAQLMLPADAAAPLSGGDVLRAYSAVELNIPVQRQNKRVRVEGEVVRPGEFVLPPGSTIAEALAAAGGLTSDAYVFGTEFSRESVRLTQQANYDRALRDLEVEFSRASTSQRVASADEAAAQSTRETSTGRLIERLRGIKPSGRIVLQLAPDARELPNLPLEEGDRLYIPPRSTTIGVFGSVYNAGNYLWAPGREAGTYLRQAGGPTRSADTQGIFLIRANGSVVSNQQQRGGFFSTSPGLQTVRAEAGDTIFVPDELNRTTWTQDLKDWSQIIYQLGLGVAAAIAVGR